jgi:hypothetical protein
VWRRSLYLSFSSVFRLWHSFSLDNRRRRHLDFFPVFLAFSRDLALFPPVLSCLLPFYFLSSIRQFRFAFTRFGSAGDLSLMPRLDPVVIHFVTAFNGPRSSFLAVIVYGVGVLCPSVLLLELLLKSHSFLSILPHVLTLPQINSNLPPLRRRRKLTSPFYLGRLHSPEIPQDSMD